MPEISRFYGIVIRMYFDDHSPPHFHAFYAEYEAVISIESLAVLKGELPPRALGLTTEWAQIHREELRIAWRKASSFEHPGKIDPLV